MSLFYLYINYWILVLIPRDTIYNMAPAAKAKHKLIKFCDIFPTKAPKKAPKPVVKPEANV